MHQQDCSDEVNWVWFLITRKHGPTSETVAYKAGAAGHGSTSNTKISRKTKIDSI